MNKQRANVERNLQAFEEWMNVRERRGWTQLLPKHVESHWVELFLEHCC